jgi:hypothetical protein
MKKTPNAQRRHPERSEAESRDPVERCPILAGIPRLRYRSARDD